MRLIIDNREPNDMITLLKERIDNVDLENLDLGDFVIKNDNNETLLIFERKALTDLIASIKDGRYNEQSFRLSESEIDNRKIYYVIEGNIMNYCNRQKEPTKKMLFSSMLSLSYKKGFSLLHTSGPIETVEFIIRIYDKLKTDKMDTSSQKEESYTNVIKSSKKSNITKENINEIMLSQIPGVSSVIANTIMLEYKSVENLILSLKENEECLNLLKIKNKSGERKIGKNVVENIKHYLL